MNNGVIITGQVGGGGILMAISQLDLASWSYIVGILVAVAGLFGGMYWQWRKDKRANELHKVVLESIKANGVTINDELTLD